MGVGVGGGVQRIETFFKPPRQSIRSMYFWAWLQSYPTSFYPLPPPHTHLA